MRYVNTDNPTACTYRVTVVVVDGAGGSDATGVNIAVDDRTEPASAPARPTVRATEKSSTSLDVTWKEPTNAGPPITSYEVQYRTGNEAFSSNGVVITGTTATISGVDSIMRIRRGSKATPPMRCGCGRKMASASASGRQRAQGRPARPTTSRYSMTGLTPARGVRGAVLTPPRGLLMRTLSPGVSEGCSPMTRITTS